jgi:1L-myo-inositol 1-phosphate cytidylyltransferase / CDP-L-myo-inositol myo-inositolphosphotransferase
MKDGRHYTAEDVRRGYTEEKRRSERYGEWSAALIYRPVSFLVTPVFLRHAVSANAVTAIALGLTVLLPVLALALGAAAYPVIGVAAIAIALLDCVDGNIARVTASESVRGLYLDFAGDIVFRTCAYGAIGVLAASGAGASATWLLPLSILAALLAIAARLCRVHAETLTGEGVTAAPQDSARAGIVRRYLFPLASGLDALLPFAILAAGFFGVMDWLVLWLAAYSALDFLYTNGVILRRLA